MGSMPTRGSRRPEHPSRDSSCSAKRTELSGADLQRDINSSPKTSFREGEADAVLAFFRVEANDIEGAM